MKLIGALLGISLLNLTFPILAGPIDVQIDRSAQKFNLGLSHFVTKGGGITDASVKDIHSILASDFEFSDLFNLVKEGPIVDGKSEAVAWGKFGSKLVLGGTLKSKAAGIVEA